MTPPHEGRVELRLQPLPKVKARSHAGRSYVLLMCSKGPQLRGEFSPIDSRSPFTGRPDVRANESSFWRNEGQRSLLSKGVPAKLAVLMPARAGLAGEMTIPTGLATLQRFVFPARVASST